MGKFRLKAGNYRDKGSGKLYHGPTEGKPVGDVVESAHDLATLFPHKFIRLLTKAAAAKVKAKKPPIPSVDEVRGETAEDEHELVEMPEEEEIEEEEDEDVDDSSGEEEEDAGDSSVVSPAERAKRIKELVRVYGKNVTKTYRPAATKCSVKIFKDSTKQYTVVDADDLQPLKEESMSKKEMLALLKDLE